MTNRKKIRGSKRFVWIVPEDEYLRHNEKFRNAALQVAIACLLRLYPGYEVVYKRKTKKRLFFAKLTMGDYIINQSVFYGYPVIIRIRKVA